MNLPTIIALPTLGDRPLSHWAQTVGAFSHAFLISVIFLGFSLIPPPEHRKSQIILLTIYPLSLILLTITGGIWGVVGHVMETENVDFKTAFWYAQITIYGGYFINLLILSCTFVYLFRLRRNVNPGVACV